jgi:hypothetical protein
LPSLLTALASQASFLHFFTKLVLAAPWSGLPSALTALLPSVFRLPTVSRLFSSRRRHFRCWRRWRSGRRRCRGLIRFSSAFCNVVFFGDLGRFVCSFVGSPFLLAGLHCLFLRKRSVAENARDAKISAKQPRNAGRFFMSTLRVLLIEHEIRARPVQAVAPFRSTKIC